MDQPIATEEPTSSVGQPESPARIDRKLPRRPAMLLFLVVVAGRCAFSLDRKVFHLFPDEPATLAMARWLSGGTRWDMATSATWKPGYSTLMAPLFWLTSDQTMIIRGGLIIGAVLGGAAAVVTARLALRLTPLSVRGAVLASGIVALSPASLSASAHLWAEPLITLTVLATVAVLLRYFDAPDLRHGLAAVALSAAGYLAHSRLLPLVLVATLATGFTSARHNKWKHSAAFVTAAVVLVAAIEWYANRAYSALWRDPAETNTVRGVLGQLSDPGAVLLAASGQIWYLLVSSAGLLGLGAVIVTRHAAGKAESSLPSTADARVLMVTIVPLLGLSMVFMADRERVDQQIYGRYNDAVVWPILIVAIAWLASIAGKRWVELERSARVAVFAIGAAILETGLVADMTLRSRTNEVLAVPEMVPGIIPALQSPQQPSALIVTCIGLVAFAGLIVAARWRSRWPIAFGALALVVLTFGALRTHEVVGKDLNAGLDSASVAELDGGLIPDQAIVVIGFVPEQLDPGVSLHAQGYYAQLYQWLLPDHRFRVTSSGDYPDQGLVFAPQLDPILIDRSACILWRDPAVGLALWDAGASCATAESTDA